MEHGWGAGTCRQGRAGERPTRLLWFYGNGETIGAIWPVIREFRPPQAGLLVIDYPGYGASADARARRGFTRRVPWRTRRWRATPRSTGPASTLRPLARQRGRDPHRRRAPVAGLILESRSPAPAAWPAHLYRVFPLFLVRLKLDNLASVRQVHCPVLVFHGTADRLVPIGMGRQVGRRAPDRGVRDDRRCGGTNETYDREVERTGTSWRSFVR